MNIPQFDIDPALQAYMYAQHRNFIKGIFDFFIVNLNR